jgi:HAD superfamily hydrolase (TIGR01509 family)
VPSPDRADRAELPAAVLWDMDGTLVDTEPLWFAAELEVAARFGVTWSRALSEHLVGMPLDVYASMLVERGVDRSITEVVDALVSIVAERLADHVAWQPGALSLLAELAEAGVPCALVTMSYRSLAAPVVGQAPPGTFRVVVTGEDVAHGKPHPEAYLRAAEQLGVPVERCVAIEDSPPGIASAMAAGVRTLGVQHLVPVAARPGLSRLASLAGVRLADLTRILAGEVVDLLGADHP